MQADCETQKSVPTALDDGIFVFFAGEMLVKMVALGVKHSGCAKVRLDQDASDTAVAFPLRRMLEYSLDGHNVSLSAIRTVRVLRPLRAINRVP
ncbi:voltage-dependent T-type calcium channel subunit alpha-1H-like protein, partial [Lates japonicus]